MIKVSGLSKSFEEKTVLQNISTTFEPGKTNLIIGRSGSGKTVLLKCILGLFEPDSGKIMYDDRDLTTMRQKERKMLRREIGMVFQGGALFDSLTVEENVRFPLDMFTNFSGKEKLKRVNFCLDHVNITNANHMFPSEISGGMKKRVAIARAIALNPKYLFCDEPNSGLDPETSTLIDNLIHDLTKEFNMTTIINTHDMNSVIEIGDSVLFIHKGEKCWEGTKKEILNSGNQVLEDFIFANKLYAQMKKGQIH
ncbi:ABC-type transporter Mla maintaining outer membrane lipid asymmetry, ATPase component MlaF [Bacteroidales bacterium 6E]|nr:ABC-type transporter Mla maintaining outer membrane lipid asymmetry, ATPase component MlaF [Bacteroidales bacterium 6E]